jgi:hypothetical protein
LKVEREACHAVVDLGEVVCQVLGLKEMISILAIGEVIARKIRARHDDLIIYTIQFHML